MREINIDSEFKLGYTKMDDSPELIEHLIQNRTIAYQERYGHPADRDRYDEVYHHIYILHKPTNQIVAAYRIALSRDVIREHGFDSLYSYGLYQYDNNFIDAMVKPLEIGRMFISEAYQLDPKIFIMLWQGVTLFIRDHPGCCYIYGAMNIHSAYSHQSITYIEQYCDQKNHYVELFQHIEPRHPFMSDQSVIDENRQFKSMSELNILLKEKEPKFKRLPVLLKRYGSLKASFGKFASNKHLQTIDVLTVVKLNRIPKHFLSRLIGKDLAQSMFQSLGPDPSQD